MKLSLIALLLPVLAFGCAAQDDHATSDESNLDTSGCSGVEQTKYQGALVVEAVAPPTTRCWNIDTSGVDVTYRWTQLNDSTPRKTSIGFYVALNGGDDFQKAEYTECHYQPGGGYSHDTSGNTYYTCTASKRFDFGHQPELKAAAYNANGGRLPWQVQIAVALDDNGNWDSLNGANYQFAF